MYDCSENSIKIRIRTYENLVRINETISSNAPRNDLPIRMSENIELHSKCFFLGKKKTANKKSQKRQNWFKLLRPNVWMLMLRLFPGYYECHSLINSFPAKRTNIIWHYFPVSFIDNDDDYWRMNRLVWPTGKIGHTSIF